MRLKIKKVEVRNLFLTHSKESHYIDIQKTLIRYVGQFLVQTQKLI